jgi:hypothetical protein
METLLAMTIVSTIGVLIVASFAMMFQAADDWRSDEEQEHEARSALHLIASDIMGSRSDLRFPWIGLNRGRDGASSDVLAILTTASSRVGGADRISDAVRVAYSKEGNRLVRWIMPNIYSVPNGKALQSEIARNVLSFDIHYYNRTLKTWTDSWEGSSFTKTPFAVVVRLTMDHTGTKPRTYTEWLTIPILERDDAAKI